ncbi:hypothetical protein [Tunturiibacter gelidoferens]|uniref:Cytochrome P460 domain-containing protein n=1 Tax=Tunturiibacter gelidiferens TaxID=3069689 RepID=A0A9X0QC49_9BACT|nr:hypothetical protein [Edaphobacter lichenicola]MBB5327523.1 hypothetical protein [Edaphobacter lichenicola]
MRLSPNPLTAITALAATLFLYAAGNAPANPDAPRYDADGRLMVPKDYRDWVFLSAGVDMSYSEHPAVADAHIFDNVFALPTLTPHSSAPASGPIRPSSCLRTEGQSRRVRSTAWDCFRPTRSWVSKPT